MRLMQKFLRFLFKVFSMEIIEKVGKLIKSGKPLEALEIIKEDAPDDVKKIVDSIFDNPEEIKKLNGVWRLLVMLTYFSYTSMYTAKRNDKDSLVSCVVSSVNAVKLCNELGLGYLVPLLLRNAARALIMMDLKEQAEKFYLEAEVISEKIKDFSELARTESDLAALYYELSRYEEARDKIEKALKMREKVSKEEFAETLMSAAEIYLKTGEFSKAEKCYKEAKRIYRRLINTQQSLKFNLAITLSNFGLFYKKIGRFNEAEKLLTESLNIFQELESKDRDFSQFVATALRHLGDLNREMKNYEKAKDFYEKSREKFREIQARWERLGG